MPILFLTAIAVIIRILSNPVANLFQKSLTAKGHHPLVINFMSYLGLTVLCLPFIFRVPWAALSGTFWIYALLSGMAGAVGNGFLVRALEKGDLSVLGPVNAYKSVVGIIVGIFLLGELPNLWGLAGTALIIWGSYFVLDTTDERFSWRLFGRKEIQFRLWALVLTAIEAVLLKKVILTSDVTIAFYSWCMMGAFFSYWLLPLYNVQMAGSLRLLQGAALRLNLSLYLFLLLCLGAMQLTTNYVFDHMPVGYALALFQLSILISVLLGYRFFKEKNIAKKLLGAVIMIIGSVVIILLK